MAVQPHLHRAVVHAFLQGEVESEADVQTIAEHLAHCSACELEFDRQAATSSRLFDYAPAAEPSTVKAAEAETLDTVAPPPAVELPPELTEHVRWKWLGRLGTGGHGVVYLARHKLLRDQLRAIKIIATPLEAEAEATKRILREINTIRRVPPHENLLAVHDVERVGIFHLIVMEHVLGQDLESLAAAQPQGRLDPAVAVDCVLQALAALDHASSTGLVHRDLKPANLMITPQGIVKVLDFGLAKIRSETNTSITIAGVQGCGSAEYLAPEQARDFAAADARSDLYSLGCTLYRLIAGHPPFGAHSGHRQAWQVHAAHAQQPVPPLAEVCPTVPRGLSEVVARLLAKNPAERFATAKEAAIPLVPYADAQAQSRANVWLGTEAAAHVAPGVKSRRTWPRILVAAALLLAAVSLAVMMQINTKAGLVELEVDDPSVEVKIDDKTIDRTRIKVKQEGSKHWLLIEARPGQHEVKVSRPGFKVTGANVEVQAGRSSPLRIRLVPKDPAPIAKPTPPETAQSAPSKSVDRRATMVLASGGRWAIEEDELRHHNGNGEQWLLFGDREWTDYDFTFEARHEGFPLGVTAVYRSSDDEHFQHFGYAWLNLKTCLAEYRDPKSFYHRVQREGKPIELMLEEPIVSDRWYKLKVEVRGDVSKFYADGRQLLTVDDNLYDRGRVGVRIWRKWHGSTRFRDLRVTAPDGKVLWEGLPELPPEQPTKLLTPEEDATASSAPAPNVAEDLLEPGSIWTGWRAYRKGAWAGSTVSYDLHVVSRDGTAFAGHVFDNGPGRNRCEVNGKVEGTTISWREITTRTTNVTEVEGTIGGNEMRLSIAGEHQNGMVYMQGDAVLRLKKHAGSAPP